MILVDTSVIVVWLDKTHPQHRACTEALDTCVARDTLAISSVTYAELASGARTRDGVDEALRGFERVALDFDAAWRAGQAFRQHRRPRRAKARAPGFLHPGPGRRSGRAAPYQ